MIVKLEDSPLPMKRFRITIQSSKGRKQYDFGLKGGHTFIDGESEQTRQNYLKRHLGNPTEYTLIKELVPSPSLFSAYLLWGKFRSVDKNIKHLNSLWHK
jgi:hypothetical protein